MHETCLYEWHTWNHSNKVILVEGKEDKKEIFFQYYICKRKFRNFQCWWEGKDVWLCRRFTDHLINLQQVKHTHREDCKWYCNCSLPSNMKISKWLCSYNKHLKCRKAYYPVIYISQVKTLASARKSPKIDSIISVTAEVIANRFLNAKNLFSSKSEHSVPILKHTQ